MTGQNPAETVSLNFTTQVTFRMGRPPKYRKIDKKAQSGTSNKYDAEFNVLQKTYGSLADLRRELADSTESRDERKKILKTFAECKDQQRAWLLLEDYFEKLSLSRKDFPLQNWWNDVMDSQGTHRLEETALAFLKADHPLPPELIEFANFEKFAELEKQEENEQLTELLDDWLFPGPRRRTEVPKSSLRVLCTRKPVASKPGFFALHVEFLVFRPRTGERIRSPREIVDLNQRGAQEQELFHTRDWAFIKWVSKKILDMDAIPESIMLDGIGILEWFSQWAQDKRFEDSESESPLRYNGHTASIEPTVKKDEDDLRISFQLSSDYLEESIPFDGFWLMDGSPPFVLAQGEFYLVKNPPNEELVKTWSEMPALETAKLGDNLLTRLRSRYAKKNSLWEEVCDAHPARPQMIFEIENDTIRINLHGVSEKDGSHWFWDGDIWKRSEFVERTDSRPEILYDERLAPAIDWLGQLNCFSPEPGTWIADAEGHFLERLASMWNSRPKGTEFLGNHLFHRLFIRNNQARPKLSIKTTGIDWFSVSTEWEIEGLKLTAKDLAALRHASSRFVKLPDSGWVEIDEEKVMTAHEVMADIGVDGLAPDTQKVHLGQAGSLEIQKIDTVGDAEKIRELQVKISQFQGIDPVSLPDGVHATLRPYQKEGFSFLANLFQAGLGGLLADDMGLGKTLQTLVALEWLRQRNANESKPCLVICPASVLHNWKREANRFVPDMKVLILESGKERHNLRLKIPDYDLIVTNYALMRRDLQALKKFDFLAVILDEAQFIKNPGAQVTQSVKQLKADHRVALTGTPLENRLLDLWSIVDFLHKGYLGNQSQFVDRYQGNEESPVTQRISRRRLAAKLRPILIRRLKTQVAKDLPDRMEERRDCQPGKAQKKLYLAELRRSREEVNQVVTENGIQKSKIHVLAALTRLRQICCHPKLVGSDAVSGKTETFFELIEPLLESGEKVLVFSQFVKMLNILKAELDKREKKTYSLTGETRNRQEVVKAFQDDNEASVFLLSLRAAGTGLNLTTASYVVLYDPWWNPAVEAQAIDRSHRIGQTKTVNAYRLITPGTVEEKIWNLQQKKSQQISDILGEDSFTQGLSHEDLDYLFDDEGLEEVWE